MLIPPLVCRNFVVKPPRSQLERRRFLYFSLFILVSLTDCLSLSILRSDGVVSMGEYMAFMISRETENVGSSQEVINAFKALTEGGKRLYVTEAELYQVTSTPQI